MQFLFSFFLSAHHLVFQQLDIVLFLVFLSFCAARIFMILASISFSFFYMLAAVISILAFLRSLTYSSLSLSSAATVAHVANALTSTGKIPLFRHSWLKVRWWHSVTYTFLKQVYTGSHVPFLMLASSLMLALSFMSAHLHGERAGFSIPAEPRGYMVWRVLRWW